MEMFNPIKQEMEKVTYYNMHTLQAYSLFMEGYSSEEVATMTPMTLQETRSIETQMKVCL